MSTTAVVLTIPAQASCHHVEWAPRGVFEESRPST